MVERRGILKTLGLGGLSALFGNGIFLHDVLAQASQPFALEEIPAAASGISWVHTSGRSSEMYLPETVGAGCAFLDYDNDGWMDVYLVNSGPSDFYTPNPALKNALYRNNHD